MLCKGNHLLRNCLDIPKVFELWSIGSHQPFSLALGDDAGSYKPSTSKAHGKNGKVKFPLMDEGSKELENLTSSQPCLSVGYQKLSPNPSLVDQVVGQKPSLVNPTLYESESHEVVLDQPLVEKNGRLSSTFS